MSLFLPTVVFVPHWFAVIIEFILCFYLPPVIRSTNNNEKRKKNIKAHHLRFLFFSLETCGDTRGVWRGLLLLLFYFFSPFPESQERVLFKRYSSKNKNKNKKRNHIEILHGGRGSRKYQCAHKAQHSEEKLFINVAAPHPSILPFRSFLQPPYRSLTFFACINTFFLFFF